MKGLIILVVLLVCGCGREVSDVERVARDKIACEQSGGTVEITTPYGNWVTCKYK